MKGPCSRPRTGLSIRRLARKNAQLENHFSLQSEAKEKLGKGKKGRGPQAGTRHTVRGAEQQGSALRPTSNVLYN